MIKKYCLILILSLFSICLIGCDKKVQVHRYSTPTTVYPYRSNPVIIHRTSPGYHYNHGFSRSEMFPRNDKYSYQNRKQIPSYKKPSSHPQYNKTPYINKLRKPSQQQYTRPQTSVRRELRSPVQRNTLKKGFGNHTKRK